MTGEKKKTREIERGKEEKKTEWEFQMPKRKNRANTKNTSKYTVGDGGWGPWQWDRPTLC